MAAGTDDMATIDTYEYKVTNSKPFTMRRVVRVGSSIAGTPSVVKCKWTPIKVENLNIFEARIEDARSTRACNLHENCKGHLCKIGDAYLIPYGFALGGEIASSDGSLLNQAVISGEKSKIDVSNHCYKRIATKSGILRKSCNGCRPTNSFRLVASPGRMDPGLIQIPARVMDRATFVYISENGRCTSRRLVEGDTIVMGRCPSQGSDSALPMKVVIGEKNVNSVRVPLEICRLNNADFDGDELWMLVPMSLAGFAEVEEAWNRVWGSNLIKSVFGPAYLMAMENEIDSEIDPAMLTTMTFEEMGSHPGGQMYESMMLKAKSWKEMYRIMISKAYWRSCVMRCESGIMNTVTSRHGLAGPYGFMRMGMMMGTCVNMRDNTMVIDSLNMPVLPMLSVVPAKSLVPCSSAMTKLTKVMYQSGIDTSKHGASGGRVFAINALLGMTETTYAIVPKSTGVGPAMIPSSSAYMMTDMYTSMSSLRKATSPTNLVERAYMIIALVEELDAVSLTDEERISVAFLLSFLSLYVTSFDKANSIEIMSALGLDWYTSVTCSDVRWIKNVMRGATTDSNVSMSTDISSILGSIFIGNMSMIASRPGIPYRCETVLAGSGLSAY